MASGKNFLVPPHRKLQAEEVEELLQSYSLESTSKLPKIRIKDPALADLDVEVGDVIEITRKPFREEVKYYRVVIE